MLQMYQKILLFNFDQQTTNPSLNAHKESNKNIKINVINNSFKTMRQRLLEKFTLFILVSNDLIQFNIYVNHILW